LTIERPFVDIERLFDAILASEVLTFSTQEKQEIRHFVDVGEYAVALETALFILEEEKKKPTPEDRRIMTELAKIMRMDISRQLNAIEG
jgi:hypothetical protein